MTALRLFGLPSGVRKVRLRSPSRRPLAMQRVEEVGSLSAYGDLAAEGLDRHVGAAPG